MHLNLSSIAYFLLLIHLSGVCLEHTTDDGEVSWKIVEEHCNQKLRSINSFEEFDRFMHHFLWVTKNNSKPRRGLLNLEKSMRTCFEAKDRLLALAEIVGERKQGVCQMRYVNLLIDYHVKYMIGKDKSQAESNKSHVDLAQIEAATRASSIRSSFDAHFFSLLANQVALTCRKKLYERLNEAQSKQSCSSVINLFIPHNSDDDEMAMAAENFINQFKRIEDYAPLPRQSESSEPYFELIISDHAMKKIEALKDACRKREPYYKSLFSPIALLAQLGYSPEETSKEIDHNSDGQDAKLLACWLATAQLCQGILRTHLNLDGKEYYGHDEKGDVQDDEFSPMDKKVIEVKFGRIPDDIASLEDNDSVGSCYVDVVDSISQEVLRQVKKSKSIKTSIKRRALVWAKNFVERHVDIEARRKMMISSFVDELTNDFGSLDTPVAFAGAKMNNGMFLPGRYITDNADTVVQSGSFFASKPIALVLSSAVAVTLSAVFVWFAIYAAVASCRQSQTVDSDGNFKENWRKSYSERINKLENKKNSWKNKMMVYKGSS